MGARHIDRQECDKELARAKAHPVYRRCLLDAVEGKKKTNEREHLTELHEVLEDVRNDLRIKSNHLVVADTKKAMAEAKAKKAVQVCKAVLADLIIERAFRSLRSCGSSN